MQKPRDKNSSLKLNKTLKQKKTATVNKRSGNKVGVGKKNETRVIVAILFDASAILHTV